jgi:hypothetical protein
MSHLLYRKAYAAAPSAASATSRRRLIEEIDGNLID